MRWWVFAPLTFLIFCAGIFVLLVNRPISALLSESLQLRMSQLRQITGIGVRFAVDSEDTRFKLKIQRLEDLDRLADELGLFSRKGAVNFSGSGEAGMPVTINKVRLILVVEKPTLRQVWAHNDAGGQQIDNMGVAFFTNAAEKYLEIKIWLSEELKNKGTERVAMGLSAAAVYGIHAASILGSSPARVANSDGMFFEAQRKLNEIVSLEENPLPIVRVEHN